LIRNRLAPRKNSKEQVAESVTNSNIQEGQNVSVQEDQLTEHKQPHYLPNNGAPYEEKTAEQKKKIRCKKWPMCKSETCEYAHPKETVIYF
jgi:hypothetical protein